MGIEHVIAIVGVILSIAIGLVVYLIPTIIAFRRKKANKMAILAINLLLGWSVVGWIWALVWALKQDIVDTNVR